MALPQGLILAGGMRPDNSSTAETWSLQLPDTGVAGLTAAAVTAKRLPPLGIRVHDTAAALVSGVPLVFGGGNSSEVDAVQRVLAGTPTAGTPARPSSPIGHLPVPNSDLAAVDDPAGLLGPASAVYVVGGYDGKKPLDAVLRTTDGRTFTTVAHLAQPVRYAAVALTPQGLWVIGGEAGGRQLSTIQLLAPNSSHASIVGRLPTPTGHASAGVVQGTVVVAGGRTGTNAHQQLTDAIWALDPATRELRQAGRLPAPRADAGSVVLPAGASTTGSGDVLLLLGGEAPHPDRAVVVVTVSTGS
ncbi:MAG: hypothetical protein ACTHMW_08370 [Actinomycetes bacterium]